MSTQSPPPDAQAAKVEEDAETMPVSFVELFRFSGPADVLLMLTGSVASLALGALQPTQMVVFGAVIDTLGASALDASAASSTAQNLRAPIINFVYIAIASFCAGFTATYCWRLTGERQAAQYRKVYLRAIMRQDVGWHDVRATRGLAAAFAESTQLVETGLGTKLSEGLRFVGQFLGGIIVALYFQWDLALLLLAISPMSVGAARFLNLVNGQTDRAMQSAFATASAVCAEVLSSIRTVASFSAEPRESSRFNSHLAPAEAVGIRSGARKGLAQGLLAATGNLTISAGIIYGAQKIAAERETGCLATGSCTVSGGAVLLTMFALNQGAQALGFVGQALAALSKARAAAGRMRHTMERTPPIDTFEEAGAKIPAAALRGRVVYEHVAFRYPTRPEAVIYTDFSLVIEAGTTCALVGGSGSGKSTAVQLLERFYEPEKGRVLLDGFDLRTLQLRWLREQIGMVGQEPVLFDGTIAQNIAYGKPDATPGQIEEAARMANAHVFIQSFPDRYETRVGQGQLSGGQKQRVAIARAILKNPSILLLDEATSALDTESERVVQAALDSLVAAQRRTTIVIAHRLSTIRNADKIVVVGQGRVLEEGSHADLLARGEDGAYFKLLQSTGSAVVAQPAPQDDAAAGAETARGSPGVGGGEAAEGAAALRPNEVQLREAEQVHATAPTPRAVEDAGARSGASSCSSSSGNNEDSRAGMAPGRSGRAGATTVTGKSKSADLEAAAESPQERKARAKAEKAEKAALAKAQRARVWGMQKPERAYLLMAVIAAFVLGATMPVVGVLFMRLIRTFFFPDPDDVRREAWMWAGIMIAISVMQVCMEVARAYGLGVAGEKLTRRLRAQTFGSMLRQEMGWFDVPANSAANLSANLSRDVTLVTAVTGESMGIQLANYSTVLVGMGLIFGLGAWQLGLVAICVVPVVGMAIALEFMVLMGGDEAAKESKSAEVAGAADGQGDGRDAPLSADEQAALAKKEEAARRKRERSGQAAREQASSIVGQLASSVRTVASFGLEQPLFDEYCKAIDAGRDARIRGAWLPATITGFSQFAIICAVVALYALGGELIARGEADFESMFVVIMVMFMTAIGLGQFAQGATDQTKAAQAVSRILTVLDRKSLLDPFSSDGARLSGALQGRVVFEHVAFRYPTRPEAVIYTDFSLVIESGTTCALVGGSGSGKSTAVQLLERFYDPDSGRVLLDGADLRNLQLSWLRQQIGMVGQEPVLFDGTIAQNIAYGKPDATPGQIEEAARMANAHVFIGAFPDAYDTMVGQGGGQLSGGQKQRIAIARAILKNPSILLLDEATSALDTESERVVQAALDSLVAAQRRTTIVIAHRLSTIRTADKIAVVGKGRVLEEGTHAQLLALGVEGHYAKLVAANAR